MNVIVDDTSLRWVDVVCITLVAVVVVVMVTIGGITADEKWL